MCTLPPLSSATTLLTLVSLCQILVIFFDLVWIGFALDAPTDCAAAAVPPITGDIEAGQPSARK